MRTLSPRKAVVVRSGDGGCPPTPGAKESRRQPMIDMADDQASAQAAG